MLDQEEEEEPTLKVVDRVKVRVMWCAVGVERRLVKTDQTEGTDQHDTIFVSGPSENNYQGGTKQGPRVLLLPQAERVPVRILPVV